MFDLAGKVAFITGAARGQGRSHAVALARAGADIIAVDLCERPSTVRVAGATTEDLEETARQVEQQGRQIVARKVDIRDFESLEQAVRDGVDELGRLDIVVANAGIWQVEDDEPTTRADRVAVWQETIDINLTGTWNTLEATVPLLVDAGQGGSVIVTSSTAGLKGSGMNAVGTTAYSASKHAVVGLTRTFAQDLAPHSIRVNSIHPTGVGTPMIMNDLTERYMEARPVLAERMANLLPVPYVDPGDVSNAVLFLASESARYITGVALPVDAGYLAK